MTPEDFIAGRYEGVHKPDDPAFLVQMAKAHAVQLKGASDGLMQYVMFWKTPDGRDCFAPYMEVPAEGMRDGIAKIMVGRPAQQIEKDAEYPIVMARLPGEALD